MTVSSELAFAACFRDHMVFAVSSASGRSLVYAREDKMTVVPGEKQILAAVGAGGDRVQLSEYIIRNIQLQRTMTDRHQTVHASAHWIRNVLSQSIRSRSPYIVNCLFGGFNHADGEKGTPELYWLDVYGTIIPTRYGGHGFLHSLAVGVFDRYYREDMTEEESLELMQKAIRELQKRVEFTDLADWGIKVVRREGVRDVQVPKTEAGVSMSVTGTA
eukprot:TRINITY_DN50709_c0_g1_i1.p1 TRINITY_DN50709_c0_g1~~TRINITY_DN50709_c0_g1_i1.p1  ORF type:complete len:217 (+),score=36.31 TRINITY_DN50709_c0_g1_i1:185-835(+)